MTKLEKLRPFTDEDEARVQREIADDPDAPELTDEQMANTMTFAEVMKRGRGRPKLENPKQQVTVRLDADVIDAMRASGPGWQVRMNDVLAAHFTEAKPSKVTEAKPSKGVVKPEQKPADRNAVEALYRGFEKTAGSVRAAGVASSAKTSRSGGGDFEVRYSGKRSKAAGGSTLSQRPEKQPSTGKRPAPAPTERGEK